MEAKAWKINYQHAKVPKLLTKFNLFSICPLRKYNRSFQKYGLCNVSNGHYEAQSAKLFCICARG